MRHTTQILVCRCARADVLSENVTSAVLHGLRDAGVAFRTVDDLCGLSARRDPSLKQYVANGDTRIAACYPRAVKWLLRAAGAETNNGSLTVLNMRERDAREVLADLLADVAPHSSRDDIRPLAGESSDDWTPWFPVIDYERCTNCKQCLSFCLFGVFGLDSDDKVVVQAPEQCKTNCPACARVCPKVAVMFPKYDKRPINGDQVREDDLRRETVKVDVAGMMKGDFHAKLRARNHKARQRFSTKAPHSPTSGPTGVDRPAVDIDYIRKMRAELDIPEDVLAEMGWAYACGESGVRASENPEAADSESPTQSKTARSIDRSSREPSPSEVEATPGCS